MSRDYKRAIHVDFHTMPGIYDINNFDAEKFAETLKNAHVTYVNVVAECNLGFCYFPTKIGVVYPGLKRDLFGETVAACRKRGIGVTAYFNGGINHTNTIRHPEWCKVNKNGQSVTDGEDNYTVRTACFNTGYYDFLLGLVKEILGYGVDGIFCDCMIHTPCYCPKCLSDMAAAWIDYKDDKAVLSFAEGVKDRFCREVKKLVGDKHSFFNSMPWDEDYDDHIELECLPTDPCWTFDYFAPYAAHARALGKEVTYMTGRFQLGWGDFGGIRTKASLEHDMYDALCNGFGFSVGDHRHPARGLIEPLYKNIGDLFGFLSSCEKWTDNAEYLAEVAILTDTVSYDMWKYTGLCRMLCELKIQHDIIRPYDDFDKYRLLILPSGMLIDDALAEKSEDYLKRGGKILSCGSGGLNKEKTDFALKECRESFEYCGKDGHSHGFFRFDMPENGDENVEWAMYEPDILMKKKKGERFASHIRAYFDKHFDGLYNYLYIPPEKETEYAAAVASGNVAHIAFNVFDAFGKNYLYEHKVLVRQIIDKLLPDRSLLVSGIPDYARVTLTGNSSHTILHVKATFPESRGTKGVIDNHVTLPAGGIVKVKGKFSRAFFAPGEEEIGIKQDGEYTEIVLPQITGYKMIVLEK